MMEIFTQIHIRILFCIFLYFSSNNAFCNAREGDYSSRFFSLFVGNKHIVTQESPTINQAGRIGNSTDYIIYNVLQYGAKGDGITNDTEAFEKTWNVTCKTKGGVMLVPLGFTFFLQPVIFDGSYCESNTTVQVDGIIVAPSNKSDWVKYDLQWILFTGLSKGITIKGKGVFDGYGASWWNSDDGSVCRPHAVRIVKSSNVTVTGITIQNSPRMHIFIDDGENVEIYNFTVRSPGDSPNTDGIHVSSVQHVDIHNTTLGCGDDCVSIQSGCSDVKIYNVKCGPGHGYSIGGLGPNKSEARVSDIAVLNSTVQDSLTGVRIKTWQGGRGYVQNVVFSNITMSNVGTPIVIDQYYCGGLKNCVVDPNAIAISNVTYNLINATYTNKPVTLLCSTSTPCNNLTLSHIGIMPTPEKSADNPYCLDAFGNVLTDTIPPLKNCLLPQEAPPPAELPTIPPQAPPPAMRDENHGYLFLL